MIRTLAAALATTTCLVAFATPAAAQTREFNIPAGSLRAALDAFARQSGRQVIYRGDEVRSTQSPGVRGERTAEEALDAILADTGFKAQKDSSGAFAVAKMGNGPALTEKATSVAEVADDDQDIVVTGTNIRGVAPSSTPVQTYSAAQIRATGASTVEQFFDKLPVNFNTLRSTASVATNNETNEGSVNGIDLRGLGVGTTLVLMNGEPLAPASRGRTPDISLIPLALIKRVDVLTDGASAIYGSDAVGGVVNFILRDDFNGAETDAGFATVTSGSHTEWHIQQTLGKAWSTGNVMFSGGYYRATPLMASDRAYASAAGLFTLIPRDKRYNIFASGSQEITPNIRLFAQVLYSDRQGGFSSNEADQYVLTTNSSSSELNAKVGTDIKLSKSLNLAVNATYSSNTSRLAGVSEPVLSCCFPTRNASKSEDFDISAKIDGSLFEVPAGDVRVAIGGGYTRDQLRVGVTAGAEDATSAAYKLSRSLQYGFAEVYVPIIAPQQNIPGISRLEATVAGRYTHYSDFGSNLSPKFGLTWEPTGGIKIRGTFSKSFRAPFLSQLDAADTNYLVFPISLFPAVQSMFNIDPNKYLIGVFGNNTASKAERANTWTAGIDLTPASIPGLRASFTYFKINYSGRIAAPGATDTLFNPANYGSLFVANPSSAAIANAITGALDSANLSPVDGSDPAALAGIAGVLYDDRNVNLSYSRISGSDIQVDFTRSWLNLGAQSTIIFSYKKKVSPQTDPISAMNTVGQPISFRGRAWIGANRDAWSSQISLNYVNDYRNLANPAQSKVGSWTTVDFSASYRFSAVNGPLKGLELSMAVQNIFDRSPPFVALASDTSIPGIVDAVGFDPSNANPLGRFISFNLKKSF